jgi:hypothetical protein
MTQTRRELLQILTAVQNTRRFENQDIIPFSGFMSDVELPRIHLAAVRSPAHSRQGPRPRGGPLRPRGGPLMPHQAQAPPLT